MTKTELLDRCARDGDERLMLARVLDKLEYAQKRNVPAHTQFLSPGQQETVKLLLQRLGHPRHLFLGGYEGAERTVCLFLPDWQDEGELPRDGGGVLTAIEGRFPPDAQLGHRDILGALMGLGLTREKLGDILVGDGVFHVVLLEEVRAVLLTQWDQAGRVRVTLGDFPLAQLRSTPAQGRLIRDTVATLRLDAVLASGFSLSRSKAAGLVSGGRVLVNHRECTKTDQAVAEGDVLSCRGLGKCVIRQVLGQSKKGRIMLMLERYG